MDKKDDFKRFIRTIPHIREDVINGRYSWQQLYEIYDIYGEDDKFWNVYKKSNIDLNSVVQLIKNIDLDALSKSFEGINKILEIIDGFVEKEEKVKMWYDE